MNYVPRFSAKALIRFFFLVKICLTLCDNLIHMLFSQFIRELHAALRIRYASETSFE